MVAPRLSIFVTRLMTNDAVAEEEINLFEERYPAAVTYKNSCDFLWGAIGNLEERYLLK